ncbi:MAG: efflux RND transporter periplasmic adaptor subunit [Candidatus Hydrogenedentes bacterium]|nr:efflux RND transporter periplasmic adaptor subunit [Candidatus Hydrogenedentota bacterium]
MDSVEFHPFRGKWAAQILVSLALLSLAACGGKHGVSPATANLTPTAVTAPVETVAKQPFDLTFEAVGTVRSKTVSTVQSKAVGNVTAVHVVEGQTVEASAPLADIDDREAQAMVANTQAGLDAARKASQEAVQSAQAAQAAVAASKANLDLANATYERFKGLYEQKVVSRQAYDEAEAKQKSAAAELTRAQESMNAVQSRTQEAAARVQQAEAQVANAQAALSHTKVVAPYAGVVARKFVDVGDLASPGSALFELEDNKNYRIEAEVNESQSGQVAIGDKASVRIDAASPEALAGTVSEIVPAANTSSRSFTVKVDVPNSTALRSGQFGRVTFSHGTASVISVPAKAVVERGQLIGVFVVDGEGIARLRLIKTGKTLGERVEVLSGLNEGERVVVDNVANVVDGCRIAA